MNFDKKIWLIFIWILAPFLGIFLYRLSKLYKLDPHLLIMITFSILFMVVFLIVISIPYVHTKSFKKFAHDFNLSFVGKSGLSSLLYHGNLIEGLYKGLRIKIIRKRYEEVTGWVRRAGDNLMPEAITFEVYPSNPSNEEPFTIYKRIRVKLWKDSKNTIDEFSRNYQITSGNKEFINYILSPDVKEDIIQLNDTGLTGINVLNDKVAVSVRGLPNKRSYILKIINTLYSIAEKI